MKKNKDKKTSGIKLFLFLLLIFFNSCSNEEYIIESGDEISEGVAITEEIAKEVAINFYEKTCKSKNELLRTQNSSTSVLSTKVIKDFNDQKGIYIVNIEAGGWVLVSSNSKNIPVVAYSDTGFFEFDDTSSDGLKSWIAKSILYNNVLETKDPIKKIAEEWYYLSNARMPYPGDENGEGESSDHTVILSHSVNEQIGPLIETTWDQNFPYNTFTPNNYPTGCVAVATAQIMKYHQWPNTFDWLNMPNHPSSMNSGLEVARLMSSIGGNVNMQYSSSGSGAYSEDARSALVNNYGYSADATYSAYNFHEVRQEITMGNRPVYMRGFHSAETTGWWFWQNTSYSAGHAWVCDGYNHQYNVYIHNQGTQYEYEEYRNSHEWLHMNWGWGGIGNGWFYQDNLLIYGVDILVDGNAVHPNFHYNRKCIYKIKH